MSDILPAGKQGKTIKIVIGVIFLAALIGGAIYYFVTRNKSKANAITDDVMNSSRFSAADKAIYQKMLQRFKAITGKGDGDIFWLLDLMNADIQAGTRQLPATYFYENGKPMLSGYLLANLESGWYGYGYNNKTDRAASDAIDNQWNQELSAMLQQYQGAAYTSGAMYN